MRIPRQGPVYAFNDANIDSWDNSVRYFLSDFRKQRVPGLSFAKKPSARYMGALVADIHNLLFTGGIFGYPGTASKVNGKVLMKRTSFDITFHGLYVVFILLLLAQLGKIRLLYEANPLALLIEQAGGVASNGLDRILDIPLLDIHQRTPLFIGSADTVEALEKYVRFYHLQ